MRSGAHQVAAVAALLVACGSSRGATDAGQKSKDGGGAGGTPGVIALRPIPEWWDLSEDGTEIFVGTRTADGFTVSSYRSEGRFQIGSVTTHFGPVDVVRGPEGSVVASGLNPDRWPALYTVFSPGAQPTEISRCSVASVPSSFEVGAAADPGFWVVFHVDCQSVCQGARVMLHVAIDGGVITASNVVCNGARPRYETRVIGMHPYERELVEFEPLLTRLVRFGPDGKDVMRADTGPRAARFAAYLTDAPSLLAEDMLDDGGSVIREYALEDGGIVVRESAFAGAGRLQSIRGSRNDVLVLAQGPALFATKQQKWVALVRNVNGIQTYEAVTPSADKVKAVPGNDGGVRAYAASTIELDGGGYELRLRPLDFTVR